MVQYPGCMLAGEFKAWPVGAVSMLVEPKLDGYRLSAVIDEAGEVSFHCRGTEAVSWSENLGHIAAEIKAMGFRSCMLDGEVMAATWNQTAKLVRRKRSLMTMAIKAQIVEEVCFHVFDLVPLNDGSFFPTILPRRRVAIQTHASSLKIRRQALQRFFDGFVAKSLILTAQFEVKSEAELNELVQEFLALKYEGAMVKDPAGMYVLDRHDAWMKIKPTKPLDLTITGCVEGTGKYVGMLGAFTCVDSTGTQIRVGTGLVDAQRVDFWSRREALIGLAIEAKCQDDDVATARHPVFIRLRDERI